MSAFLSCCGSSRRPARVPPAPDAVGQASDVVDWDPNGFLCSVCDGMFRREAIRSEPLHLSMVHHSTIHGFVEAADSGCWICWRLFQALDDATRSSLRHIASSHKNYMENAYYFSAAVAEIIPSNSGGFRLDLGFEFGSPDSPTPEVSDCSQCNGPHQTTLFESLKDIAYFAKDRRRELCFALIPSSAKGTCLLTKMGEELVSTNHGSLSWSGGT